MATLQVHEEDQSVTSYPNGSMSFDASNVSDDNEEGHMKTPDKQQRRSSSKLEIRQPRRQEFKWVYLDLISALPKL